MRAVCEDFGCELVEFNGETEHVHLLVNFPPDRRTVPARQQPEGRLVPAAAAGVPRPGPALLAGQAAVVGVVLRRLGRRYPLNVLRAYIEQQRRPYDATHLRPEGRSPLAKAW